MESKSRAGTGTTDSLRGSFTSSATSLDAGSPRTPIMMESKTTMDNIKQMEPLVINHKTKVSEVLPPGRIVYEWEWNIGKFEKAFPQPKNYPALYQNRTRVLKSEKIVAGADIHKRSNWYFLLSETDGHLSCFLLLDKIHKAHNEFIHTAFTFKVVDINGKELLQQSRCFRDFREKFQCGWDDFIMTKDLYDQKHVFLAESTLRIRVLFEMYANATDRDAEALKQETSEFSKIVSHDLHRLRTATGTADVHLDCEGKVFPVHKLILSARSPAFARMFESTLGQQRNGSTLSQGYRSSASTSAGGDNPPDAEQTIGIVPILDVEPNILEIVLDYIYSGNVQPLSSPEVLNGVVRAADKFELSDLKSYCFNSLMNFLNEENIGQLAVLAFRHHADRNVRMNINGFCVRNVTTLMRRAAFRDSLKSEPDAFFLDEDENQ